MTTTIEPTPFGADRALEIWENKGPAAAYVLTPGEDAYVKQVWDLLGDESSWTTALMNIAHGGAIPAAMLQKGDVITFLGGRGLHATITGVHFSGYETVNVELTYTRDGAEYRTYVRKVAREPVLILKPDPRDMAPTTAPSGTPDNL
jgi:hypothetical protein